MWGERMVVNGGPTNRPKCDTGLKHGFMVTLCFFHAMCVVVVVGVYFYTAPNPVVALPRGVTQKRLLFGGCGVLGVAGVTYAGLLRALLGGSLPVALRPILAQQFHYMVGSLPFGLAVLAASPYPPAKWLRWVVCVYVASGIAGFIIYADITDLVMWPWYFAMAPATLLPLASVVSTITDRGVSSIAVPSLFSWVLETTFVVGLAIKWTRDSIGCDVCLDYAVLFGLLGASECVRLYAALHIMARNSSSDDDDSLSVLSSGIWTYLAFIAVVALPLQFGLVVVHGDVYTIAQDFDGQDSILSWLFIAQTLITAMLVAFLPAIATPVYRAAVLSQHGRFPRACAGFAQLFGPGSENKISRGAVAVMQLAWTTLAFVYIHYENVDLFSSEKRRFLLTLVGGCAVSLTLTTAILASCAAHLWARRQLLRGSEDSEQEHLLAMQREMERFAKEAREEQRARNKEQKKLLKSMSDKRFELWNIPETQAWLRWLGLEQYVPAFDDNAVDGSMLVTITEEQIIGSLAITDPRHVHSLLYAVRFLQMFDVDYLTWPWSAQDVAKWLREKGCSVAVEPCLEGAVHGAVLFFASPEFFHSTLKIESTQVVESIVIARDVAQPRAYLATAPHVRGVKRPIFPAREEIDEWTVDKVGAWMSHPRIGLKNLFERMESAGTGLHGAYLLSLKRQTLIELGCTELQAIKLSREIAAMLGEPDPMLDSHYVIAGHDPGAGSAPEEDAKPSNTGKCDAGEGPAAASSPDPGDTPPPTFGNDDIPEQREVCVVCYMCEPRTVLVPCGHMLCTTCAGLISTCPVCRQAIERRQPIFKS